MARAHCLRGHALAVVGTRTVGKKTRCAAMKRAVQRYDGACSLAGTQLTQKEAAA